MKIENKIDWSHVYTAETPADYMLFSRGKEYIVPEYAMRYLGSLFEKLSNDLQRSVKIMDLGSSYGIISTLKLCDLTWSQLIDFYVEDNQLKKHSWRDIEKFYMAHLQDTNKYKFYLLDSSKPAIEFAKNMNLCEEGYAFDLKHDSLTDELKDIVPQIDIFICVGSIGYIGHHFFKQILPLVIAKSSLPLLAFSTYPVFYYDICSNDIEAEFRKYDYDFICCNAPGKGRRMTDAECEISQKSKFHQALDICRFENEGYYTSAFYMAVPKDRKMEFENWMINQDKCI